MYSVPLWGKSKIPFSRHSTRVPVKIVYFFYSPPFVDEFSRKVSELIFKKKNSSSLPWFQDFAGGLGQFKEVGLRNGDEIRAIVESK